MNREQMEKRIAELEDHFRWLEFRLGSPAIEGYLRFVIKQVFPEGGADEWTKEEVDLFAEGLARGASKLTKEPT